MANKLTEMELPSVDVCHRGANPLADIKLFKSADHHGEGGERENMADDKNFVQKVAKALADLIKDKDSQVQVITKSVGTAQINETTEALRKSLESILSDDSMTAVEKHDMMAESLQQFTLEATDLMDGWAAAQGVEKADPEPDDDGEEEEEEEETEEPGGEPEDEDIEKGVFDMATIDINKMSPEDRATLEALEKKYTEGQEPTHQDPQVHPDVQKAIDEVAELRKSLEMAELTNVAKKYEVLGKKADELAPKLYDLKKAGEQHYNDYVALLDEQVTMANNSIFKEYGTNRSGATDLDATVAELRKADPNLTMAQAVCKAYESNPNLDPFTGKVK